jgi:hypothetical protein
LQKAGKKPNKLNSCPFQIGVLRTFFARVLDAPKGAPQACGCKIIHYDISIIRSCNCAKNPFIGSGNFKNIPKFVNYKISDKIC